MNQSLINEIRTCEIQIRLQLKKLEEHQAETETWYQEKTKLLLAQSNCLNALAVLVAANKR